MDSRHIFLQLDNMILMHLLDIRSYRLHNENTTCLLSLKTILILAVATSIDALAVGISFAFLQVHIWTAITVIGVTTFVLSFIAVYLGNRLGDLLEKYAGILGGIILILIGTKILLEHLFG